MDVSLATRKPAQTLTPNDFCAYRVWEFASDEEGVGGRDESWVRPIPTEVVPRRSYLLVAAAFKDRRGFEFDGYVIVSTLDNSIEILNGSIFKDGESFFVPNPEVFGYRQARLMLMEGLGLREFELSPITFTLKLPVEGLPGLLTGELRLPPPSDTFEVQLSLW